MKIRMKRGASAVAGQRDRSAERVDDVASFRNVNRSAPNHRVAGAGHPAHPGLSSGGDQFLMAEFDDFMQAEEGLASGVMSMPSPVFRERLRQRLWRAHVISHVAPSGRELH